MTIAPIHHEQTSDTEIMKLKQYMCNYVVYFEKTAMRKNEILHMFNILKEAHILSVFSCDFATTQLGSHVIWKKADYGEISVYYPFKQS